jgi:hypothetical protein
MALILSLLIVPAHFTERLGRPQACFAGAKTTIYSGLKIAILRRPKFLSAAP